MPAQMTKVAYRDLIPSLLLSSQQSCKVGKAKNDWRPKVMGSFMAKDWFESGSSSTQSNSLNTAPGWVSEKIALLGFHE